MKEDTRPLMVSIWCITYNHEPYIRQCLEGFVMQETNFRFEAIVHDDASTDNTAAIIREYVERYPDIIKPIFETENQYSKDNAFLQKIMGNVCKGKYIAYCEGDDYWTDPYKLQKQVDFLENNSEYILVHSDFAAFNNSKNIFIHHAARKYKIYNGDVFEHLFEKCFIRTPTVLHRNIPKEIPIQCEPEDMFKGDLYLFYWLSKKGKFYFLDEEMAVYRVLENSASHFTSEEARYIAFEKGRKLDYFIADYYGVDSVIKEKLDAKWFVINLKSCVRTGNCDYLQKLSSPNDFVQLKYVILYKCCKFPVFLNFVKLLNEYKKFLYKKWF